MVFKFKVSVQVQVHAVMFGSSWLLVSCLILFLFACLFLITRYRYCVAGRDKNQSSYNNKVERLVFVSDSEIKDP